MRLLIADDDAVVRQLVFALAQGLGFEPVEASDGIEAIAAFEQQQFRFALIDMMMPNKDGIETIMELKRRWPSTRVIAMSAGSRFVSRTEATDWGMGLGADAALLKPFSVADLQDALMTQLRQAPPAHRVEGRSVS